MSKNIKTKKFTPPTIKAMKSGEKIVALTAYTARMAELLDNYCEILLVGDSLGMVVYGMDSTLNVSLRMMIDHGKAVATHVKNSLVVVDMPFGSYQKSKEQAFANCSKVMMKTGCGAVKIEGGAELVETVEFLVNRGIPVMTHIGLMPQHHNVIGGFKSQGHAKAEQKQFISIAKSLTKAGSFAMILEAINQDLANEITKTINIPTIAIGGSQNCDGQILVTEDMLGMHDNSPKFVKNFAELKDEIQQAASNYKSEVKSGKFPEDKHCYISK